MTDDNIIDLSAPYGRKKDGTPRKPTGFQRGGAEYRPPSGIPAGGQLNGPAGPNDHSACGKPMNGPDALRPFNENPALLAERAAQNKFNAEREAQEMLEIMLTIAKDITQHPSTRLLAAEKTRNQIIGTPISRQITATTDDVQGLTVEFVPAKRS